MKIFVNDFIRQSAENARETFIKIRLSEKNLNMTKIYTKSFQNLKKIIFVKIV